MREKRLEFMKNNPEKTAWRLSNVSYPEKLCIEYIEKNSLDKKYSIVREYSVFPYFIDFAFVNEMVAVEIDGSQHLLPERKERDDKKDKLLDDLGWLVIRVSEKEIKTNIDEVFKQILLIFGFTEKQIQSIKSQRRVERPPIDELKKLIEKNGYRGTGKIFGISDNAIRKWLKSYNKGL
ncbi:MAG: DUF559 domain-containing protein [Actinobacteria bacterium]|nr:DUF559 domain-containing protein [Actinomycetota bacterium]